MGIYKDIKKEVRNVLLPDAEQFRTTEMDELVEKFKALDLITDTEYKEYYELEMKPN